ncbi:T9SS type A sorting domain-containing protein [bacterium]|nr:T9SS type A sorting domain-containing protein [bacterium]
MPRHLQRLCALLLVLCLHPQQLRATAVDDVPPRLVRPDLAHVHAEAAAKERNAKAFLAAATTATPNQELYDVHHYNVALTLNVDLRRLTGTVTTTAEVVGDSLTELDLNMVTTMRTLDVTAAGAPSTFSHANDIVTVHLDRTYYAGETVQVGVHYLRDFSITIQSDPFQWVRQDGLYNVFSYSEPYGAREWWPCKDINTDKADSLDLYINVPEGMACASNGRLVTDYNFDTWHRWQWKTNHPIATYLFSLAVYPYTRWSDWYTPLAGGDPMEVSYFVFPSHADSVQDTYAQTVPMLEAFADAFGEYPFVDEKYGHAEFAIGGGMEHQTISSLGGWSEDVIAHELTHQWWGDMVTCADFGHIWLNEGLAMFGEAYWHEQRYGVADYRSYMAGISYFGPGTVFVEDPAVDDIFDVGLTYFKGGWVVHMLRGILGDADFFAALDLYRAGHAYGTATTADFQAAMETVSGLDLEAFFQQWIYGDYYPVYRMDWEPGPSAGQITVTIDQIQELGGVFAMPITLRIATDVSTTDVVVQNDQSSQQYVLPVDGVVGSVALDPDHWILSPYPLAGAQLDRGVLVVNGVHWETYSPQIEDAYEARAFWGDTSIAFWDCFPVPAGGYPSTLPEPLGHGAVPASVLGHYSTVIWVGNNYEGDIYSWLETPIRQYLEAGGNVLLMTRYSHDFLFTGLDKVLGVELAEPLVTLADCTAMQPELVDIPLLPEQTFVGLFTTNLGSDTVPLFHDTVNSPTRLTSVLHTPPLGGAYRPDGGRFALIGGRPYRMDAAALSANVETILADRFSEPYHPSAVPDDRPDGDVPARTALGVPYPNPFNPQVRIPFSLAAGADVSLTVYDLRGRLVRHLAAGDHAAGFHAVMWDGTDDAGEGVASGTYFLKLREGDRVGDTARVVLVK